MGLRQLNGGGNGAQWRYVCDLGFPVNQADAESSVHLKSPGLTVTAPRQA